MNHNIDMQLAGEFTLKVTSPRGNREYVVPNLILNAGIDRVMANSNVDYTWTTVQIGTGNTAPAATDTQLQNKIAHTTTVQAGLSHSYVAGPPDYVEASVTYRFALGALNSAVSGNFAEIGIGWGATGSLFSRALITDVNGDPTTIAVLSDEQLDVVYKLRVYPIQSDVTGSITLDGVNYDYVIRPVGLSFVSVGSSSCNWAFGALFTSTAYGAGFSKGFTGLSNSNWPCCQYAYSSSLVARTSQHSLGSIVGSVSSTTLADSATAYTNGTFQSVHQYTWNLNDANGDIKTLVIAGGGSGTGTTNCPFAHQIEFTPAIPKVNTKRLRLTFTYSFTRRP